MATNTPEVRVAHHNGTVILRPGIHDQPETEINFHLLSGLYLYLDLKSDYVFAIGKREKEMIAQIIRPGFFDPNSDLHKASEPLSQLGKYGLLGPVYDDLIDRAEVTIGLRSTNGDFIDRTNLWVELSSGGRLVHQLWHRHSLTTEQKEKVKDKLLDARDNLFREHPEYQRFSPEIDRNLNLDQVIAERAARVEAEVPAH